MKTRFAQTRPLRFAVVTFVMGALASSANADIIVRFETPDVVVDLGATFDLNIVADIPITEPVLGWGLDLTIDDPAIVSRLAGQIIGGEWDAGFATDGDGLAGLAPFGFPPTSVSGDGVLLATLTLSADAVGQTDLFLSATAGDFSEGFALEFPGAFADVTFESGQVTVIPAPGAVLLAILGLPCVGRIARRA
jgi:hypothetical protein